MLLGVFSLADPTGVRVVDRQAFPNAGWEHHLSVNDHAIYLASSGWPGGAPGFSTLIS